jgi:hypothetical protein
MYLEKGCFLTESINGVIKVAIEAELTNIWWKNILDPLRNKTVGVAGHTVLLLGHLQGAFYVLVLGRCFAFVAFLAAILHNKLKEKTCVLKATNHRNVAAPLTCTGR